MPASQIHVRVPDMKCEGCARRITNVLERQEGVRSAHVSLEEKTAEVRIADDIVSPGDLKAVVEKAGYTVEPE